MSKSFPSPEKKKRRELSIGSRWLAPNGDLHRVTYASRESVDTHNITSGGNAVYGRKWFDALFKPAN